MEGTPVSETPLCAAGQAVGAAGNGEGWRCFPEHTNPSRLAAAAQQFGAMG